MINNFWQWLMSSVQNAVNIFQTMYENTTLAPFFNLLLVVLATMVIVKFILKPIFGETGSDKAKRKDKDE